MVLNKEMNMMLFKPPHLGLSPNQKIKTVGGMGIQLRPRLKMFTKRQNANV